METLKVNDSAHTMSQHTSLHTTGLIQQLQSFAFMIKSLAFTLKLDQEWTRMEATIIGYKMAGKTHE